MKGKKDASHVPAKNHSRKRGKTLDSGISADRPKKSVESLSSKAVGKKGQRLPASNDEMYSDLATLRRREKELAERKPSEATLLESEEQYRMLFDLESDAIVVVDAETGSHLDANKAAEEMYGYTRHELLRLRATDLSAEPEKTKFRLEHDDGLVHIALRWHRKKDGTVFPVEITARFFDLLNKRCVICAMRDITARMRMEEALQESENRLKTILDSIQTGIMLIDAQTHVIVDVNPQAATIIGTPREDLVGLVCHEYVCPAEKGSCPITDLGQILDNSDRVLLTASGEKRSILKTVVPVMIHGREHLLESFVDITERKKSEEALRKSEAELHDSYFSQAALNMILSESIKDLPLDMILKKSLSMLLSVPWLSFEPVGSIHLVEGTPAKLSLKAQCNLPEQLRKSCASISFGQCLCGKAAQTQEILFSDCVDERHDISYDGMEPHGHYIVPIVVGNRTLGVIDIYLKEGHIRNRREEDFLITIADTLAGIITRRQAEAEKERLQAQLLQAQKMEAVGHLAGGIAHDFNNILTAIMGFGYILGMKMGKDDPLRLYPQRILSAAERAIQLTQSLLAFSRKQITHPRPVKINLIITEAHKIFHRIIGEDIEVRLVPSNEDIMVKVDANQMEQVLINLATNARDAMPEGGALTIKTRAVDLAEDFIRTHGFGTLQKYALISVSDTGTGMNKDMIEKIFEPFYTTKDIGKGTGLGLAIVYGIIKQHEGFIDVHSEPGKGATFEIYLPATNLLEDEEDRSEAVAAPERGSETILVAEDNAEVRSFVKEILEDSGYTVIEAADGTGAIETFLKHRDEIQLLLLDVIMPKKNGKEAYEEIKSLAPYIKTLFLSGYPSDFVHKKGILEKEHELLLKPVSSHLLLKKVREILDR